MAKMVAEQPCTASLLTINPVHKKSARERASHKCVEARRPRRDYGLRPGSIGPGTGLLQARDRGREGLRLPALRTVRAVLPHTALQLVVSTS